MLKLTDIKVSVEDSRSLEDVVADKLSIQKGDIAKLTILRKSVDARKGVSYVYSFGVSVKNESDILKQKLKNVSIYKENQYTFDYANISSEERPVIIGTGPAGLFCALMLSRAGPMFSLEREAQEPFRTESSPAELTISAQLSC